MCNMKMVLDLLVLVTVFKLCSCRNALILKKLNPNNALEPTLEYYKKPHQEVTIKIKFHIDGPLTRKLSSLPEYHRQTRRKLKLLTKNILLKVETLFNHSSLEQKIKFEHLGTKFLKNISKKLPMDENASKYLKSYCTWQSEKKAKLWYYSVLLTGLDLFYLNSAGKEVRKSTGRGYMTGMCSLRNSCTVIEWHPNNVGFLLAHEIAHSLGISHDGFPHNRCTPKGDMMGAKYNAKTHPNGWSSCSRQALKRYLGSKRAWCLKPNY